MPGQKAGKRKWFRRLFSCLLRSDNYTLENEYSREFLPSVSSTSVNSFELALKEEGLLYLRSTVDTEPVLDLCFGFTEKDLARKGGFFSLSPSYHWSTEFLQPGFEKIVEEFYFNEPIIDGLPATLWLECIEPTLSILTSLNSLKHRKSNLSLKRQRPPISDSQYSRHGDFEFLPMALLAVPRRLTMRLDLVHLGQRNDVGTTYEMQVRSLDRPQNRRRPRRYSIELLDIVSLTRTLDLDVNQSANPNDGATNQCAVYSGVTVPSDTRQTSVDQEPSDDVDDESVPIDVIDDYHNSYIYEETEEEDVPRIPMFSNPRDLVSHLCEARFAREELRQRAMELLSLNNAHHTLNRSSEIRPNITYTFQASANTSSHHVPYVYKWNASARFFSREHFEDYKLDYMKIVKAGIKYFLQITPDCDNYNEYSDRVAIFVNNDFFSRRLLMLGAQETSGAKKNLTDEEMVDAKAFLKLEECLDSKFTLVEKITPVSPAPASCDKSSSSVQFNEHQSRFARVRNQIRQFFRRFRERLQRRQQLHS